MEIIAEVNPPELPTPSHRRLIGWRRVLVTDNAARIPRLSPYAFAARITHDTPMVVPTVVVSCADRTAAGIRSEVLGAVQNGVESFLVVPGEGDRVSDPAEVLAMLLALRDQVSIRVGAPCALREDRFERRIEQGVDFVSVGVFMDPLLVESQLALLDPSRLPVWAMTAPAMSGDFVDRMMRMGGQPVTAKFRERAAVFKAAGNRETPWELCGEVIDGLEDLGCEAAILVGLRYETIASRVPAWIS